jgi:hypothetical protein
LDHKVTVDLLAVGSQVRRPFEAVVIRQPAPERAPGVDLIANIWQVPRFSGRTPGRMSNGRFRRQLSFN